jgi:hypothetical protein
MLVLGSTVLGVGPVLKLLPQASNLCFQLVDARFSGFQLADACLGFLRANITPAGSGVEHTHVTV